MSPSRKAVLAIFFGIALGGLGTWAIVRQKKNESLRLAKPADSILPTLTKQSLALATWTDEAGFSFQYPKELDFNKHDEDNENYAHLEFTSPIHPGNLIIWAREANVPNVSAWISSEKRFTGANILDTTLGGKPAKKILTSTSAATLITGTIDDTILFTVEAELTDRGYWGNVHNVIVNSFVFTPNNSPRSTTLGSPSEESESVDEEETVQ